MSLLETASHLNASSSWRQWGFKGKPSTTTARYKQFLTSLPGPNFSIPIATHQALIQDLGPAAARAFTHISQITRSPTLTQLNLQGHISATDHGDDFADICGPKPPNHLRFLLGNLQGLTLHTFWSKGTELVQFLQQNQCDGLALQEVGIHWGAMPAGKQFSSIFHKRLPSRTTAAHNSTVPPIHPIQYGGTAVAIMNQALPRYHSTSSDDTHLGRWSSICISGREGHRLRLVSIYSPQGAVADSHLPHLGSLGRIDTPPAEALRQDLLPILQA